MEKQTLITEWINAWKSLNYHKKRQIVVTIIFVVVVLLCLYGLGFDAGMSYIRNNNVCIN